MNKKASVTSAFFALISAGIFCGNVFATTDMARKEKAACALCHVNPAGGKGLSDIGNIYKEKKILPANVIQVSEDMQARYIGNKKCAACHTEVYSSWEKTSHAASFKPLVEKKAEKNAGCLNCHATGVGLPGGYSDEAETLNNVGCEACHGPGSLHAAAPSKLVINTIPSEALCKACHAKFSPKFEYTEWVKKGVHAFPGKKASAGSEEKK